MANSRLSAGLVGRQTEVGDLHWLGAIPNLLAPAHAQRKINHFGSSDVQSATLRYTLETR
ncbi:MAG TPA: hypothetical protein VFQ61_22690 [Polyangiaceae bacterium]|nr:hypothetical protein [Polyangiaceae bacterium]